MPTFFGITDEEIEQRIFAVSPFVRNYFNVSEKFYFYLQGDVSFGLGKATIENNGNSIVPENDIFAFSAGIRPGLSLFVSDKIALEAEFGFIGYSSTTNTQDVGGSQGEVKATNESYGISLDANTFNFGISLYLGR